MLLNAELQRMVFRVFFAWAFGRGGFRGRRKVAHAVVIVQVLVHGAPCRLNDPPDTGADPRDDQRHHRNPFHPLITGRQQLFAEHIGIEFAVSPAEHWRLQARGQCLQKRIVAIDHRHPGVQHQRTTGCQSIQGLLDNAQRQLRTERPAAMAVGALGRVGHVGWIGDDQVELAVDVLQYIAGLDADIGHLGERGIDRRQTQRRRVDVHGQYLGFTACAGNHNGADAGTAADVHGAPDRGEILLQMGMDQLRKPVGVGTEEHRVSRVGGKGRMHKQQIIQARPAHPAFQVAVAVLRARQPVATAAAHPPTTDPARTAATNRTHRAGSGPVARQHAHSTR